MDFEDVRKVWEKYNCIQKFVGQYGSIFNPSLVTFVFKYT